MLDTQGFLPKITFKNLLKTVFPPSAMDMSFSPSKKQHGFDTSQSHSTHEDIHINSPFYSKKSCPKPNCFCPFHQKDKKERSTVAVPEKIRPKQQRTGMRELIRKYKQEQAAKIRQQKLNHSLLKAARNQQQLNRNKDLIKTILTKKGIGQSDINQEQSEEELTRLQNMIGSIFTQMAKGKSGHQKSRGVASFNSSYENILKMRQFKRQEKELMIKTLVAFLKLKFKELDPNDEQQNKKRIANSLLQTNLNVILNHHTIRDLINRGVYENFSYEEWVRIVKVFNLQQDQVFEVFQYLKEIVDEMHNRNSLRKAQLLPQQNEGKRKNSVCKAVVERNSQSDNQTDKKIIQPEINKKEIEQTQDSQQQKVKKISGRGSLSNHANMRRSSKLNKTDDSQFSSQNKSNEKSLLMVLVRKTKSKTKFYTRNQPISEVPQKEIQIQLPKTLPKQMEKIESAKDIENKENISIEIPQPIESQPMVTTFQKAKKKLRKGKFKPEKPSRLQYLQSQINYKKYCTRDNFKVLINVIEDAEMNEQEKMVRTYDLLKIDNYLGFNGHNSDLDPEKYAELDAMMRNFEPLMNEEFREKMHRFIAVRRGNKMLEKLFKEIDKGMIRLESFESQDFGELKQAQEGSYARIMKQKTKQKLLNLIQSQDDDQCYHKHPTFKDPESYSDSYRGQTSFTHTIVANYPESKKRRNNRNSTQERQVKYLDQSHMGQMSLCQIQQNHTQLVKVRKKKKGHKAGAFQLQEGCNRDNDDTQVYFKFTGIDPERQKQILKYAKKYHPKDFCHVYREVNIHVPVHE